tara:strand:- start:346 stop:588 length:243 start_codon:yes stop_codon:yes gene_type:complete
MKWLSKENAREKFKRLAEYRVNQAVHYIGLIGNLSNNRAYDFNAEDIKKILGAIEAEVETVRKIFNEGKKKSKSFDLGDD